MNDTKLCNLISIPYGSIEYLDSIWDRLYPNCSIQEINKKIKSIHLPGGICGHKFLENEIGWCCKDCEKDSNCVICEYCFEHGCHIGHSLYLNFSVSGCCDCGDHESWDPKGFCTSHQGFISEKDADFDLIPIEVRVSVKTTITDLCSRLFGLCSKAILDDIELYETEIEGILKKLQEISKVSPILLYEIGRNISMKRKKYFYKELDEIIETNMPKEKNIIDLLIKLHSKVKDEVKILIYDIFMESAKNYNFKYSLAEGYLNNYHCVLLIREANSKCNLTTLGTQILGCEEINKRLIQDEKCIRNFIKGIKSQVREFIIEPTHDNYYLISHVKYDFKDFDGQFITKY